MQVADVLNVFRRRWIGVALTLLASFYIAWAAMIAMEKAVVPHTQSPDEIQLFMSDQPDFDTTQMTPIPVTLNKDPAYVHEDPDRTEFSVFQHTFRVDEPGLEKGLYIRWARRVVEVRVNGTPLRQQTATDLWGILGGFEPVAYVIPEDVLTQGENRLEIVNNGRSLKVSPEFFISTPSDVLRAVGWGRMFSVDLAVGAVTVMLILMLICLTANWPDRDKPRMRGLVILLSLWSIRNLTFLGVDAGVPDDYALLFHFSVTYIFIAAIAWWASAWTGQSARSRHIIAAITLVLLLAVTIMNASGMSGRSFFQTAFWIETIITVIVCSSAMVLLLWHELHQEKPNYLQLGLFLLALIAVLVDSFDDKFPSVIPLSGGLPITFYYAPMCGLVLGLGLCATLASQATAARLATENINQTLREKLFEQEQTIAASYERQQALEKESARAGERQRIMRDMHDGVGSLLLGLLVQIRGGKLTKPEIGRGVENGLNDLRLMITAMDGVGDNLPKALESFRHRIAPQLDAAEVEFLWENTLANESYGLSPQDILQVYRILQEGISNALRHADAKTVKVQIFTSGPDNSIHISLSDDGHGYDADTVKKGAGLRNMQKRAKSIGAALNAESGTSGTTLHLHIPTQDLSNQ